MNDSFQAHHLPIDSTHTSGNGAWGRLFFVPGSDGRAARIAEHFTKRQVHPSERQHNVYLGQLENPNGTIDVGAVASGMGCPSLNIVISELIGLGARLFLRVGTSGSVNPELVRVGHLVIATAGVRDEGASDCYIGREFPAIGDPDMVRALELAARQLNYQERTFKGIVQAKDSLYAVEFGHGPLGRDQHHHRHLEQLKAMGVLASDMETSHLFILGHAHSTRVYSLAQGGHPAGQVKCGAILAVVGDDAPYADPKQIAEAEDAAIQIALAGARFFFEELERA